jgi:hypothetical protein
LIKSVWGLSLENKVLGVRLQLQNGRYLDIDIDVYKKQLGLSTQFLTNIPLIEYGNMFMTEEEFNTGQMIEDGSEDKTILKNLKHFMSTESITDASKTDKFKKMKHDYKQKYYSYMPSKWLEEFAIFHITNFEGNANLYASLSTNQIKVIKEYFRWRSRLIFDEQNTSRVLRTKPVKALKLIELMGSAEDWEYDGTVDTGFKGGGFCELGHALRYEHYAVSPSSRKQIIFGRTCMSDFFQVDDRVLAAIMSAQETLIKELKSIAFILRTQKLVEYSKAYKDLPTIIDKFVVEPPKIRNIKGWVKFLDKFTKAGLPITRSMLLKYEELETACHKQDAEKDAKAILDQAVEALLSRGYTQEEVDGIIFDKYNLTLAKNLKVSILEGDIQSTFVSEGLELLPKLLSVQNKLVTRLDSIPELLQQIRKKYYFFRRGTRKRLATKNEVKYAKHALIEDVYYGRTKTLELDTLLREITPPRWSRERYPSALRNEQKLYRDNFLSSSELLVQAIKWLNNDIILDVLRVFDKPVEYLETASDEQVDETNINLQYDFISANIEVLTDAERKRFARILNHDLAHTNEIDFISNVYKRVNNRLNKQKEEAPKEPEVVKETDLLTPELDAQLDKLVDALSHGKIPQTHFVFHVIPTIRRTGKISIRQRNIVDKALELINR